MNRLVQVGKDIELATFLTRNRRPLTGKTVSVRAVDVSDGSELLASQEMTERAPALYGFLWDSAPLQETEVSVEYRWKNFFHTELVSIITSLGGGSAGQPDLEGEILTQELAGETETPDAPILDGSIEPQVLSAEKADSPELDGSIETPILEGEIDNE